MNCVNIYTAIIFVSLTFTLSAQKQEEQTIVLSDGSRLKGIVLGDSLDYLILKITSPQIVTINKSEISLLTSAGSFEKQTINRQGYSVRISASVLAGRNSEGNIRDMSVHLSNGYQLRNGISFGFGTGLEELDGVTLLPVYLDLRYNLLKTRFSPFIWTKGGWSFTFNKSQERYNYFNLYTESQGGEMLNIGSGIELASWRNNAVNIGIAYRNQKTIFKSDENWNANAINELITSYNRIEIQFGFIFR